MSIVIETWNLLLTKSHDFTVSCCVVGDDAGKIIIWNMAPVRLEEVEKDDTVPKILCEMNNHLGMFPAQSLYVVDHL